MVRKIVKIDAEKCNGCGQCVTACVEGAIQLVNGKAQLVSDSYCDGLGACLGHCPMDAITVEERDAAEFDEKAAMVHLRGADSHGALVARPDAQPCEGSLNPSQGSLHAGQPCEGPNKPLQDIWAHAGPAGHVCPGTMARRMSRPASSAPAAAGEAQPELTNWPIQLKLVAPNAPALQGADLLLAADCVPSALPDFHARFLRGKALLIGCPKLDDAPFYVEKLAQILAQSGIRSLTVLHMEVPCCSGLTRIAQAALERSGKRIPAHDVTISIEGKVLHEE